MHHEIGGWLWLAIDVVMVLILGGALIYGTTKWRQWKKHPTKVKERDRAVKEAYRQR